MDDYISRSAALKAVGESSWAGFRLNELPAADVVERPRWIPVKERLPEPNIHVLVLCEFRAGKAPKPQQYWQTVGRNTINRSKPENRYWALYGGESLFWEPTHWMPLPEPPKEAG